MGSAPCPGGADGRRADAAQPLGASTGPPRDHLVSGTVGGSPPKRGSSQRVRPNAGPPSGSSQRVLASGSAQAGPRQRDGLGRVGAFRAP